MGSKLIVLLGIFLAAVLLIDSQVHAGEVTQTSNSIHPPKESEKPTGGALGTPTLEYRPWVWQWNSVRAVVCLAREFLAEALPPSQHYDPVTNPCPYHGCCLQNSKYIGGCQTCCTG